MRRVTSRCSVKINEIISQQFQSNGVVYPIPYLPQYFRYFTQYIHNSGLGRRSPYTLLVLMAFAHLSRWHRGHFRVGGI